MLRPQGALLLSGTPKALEGFTPKSQLHSKPRRWSDPVSRPETANADNQRPVAMAAVAAATVGVVVAVVLFQEQAASVYWEDRPYCSPSSEKYSLPQEPSSSECCSCARRSATCRNPPRQGSIIEKAHGISDNFIMS